MLHADVGADPAGHKTMLATPVIRAFFCPCTRSPSTSSAGAQTIAMVPHILSFMRTSFA
jgi:hypothetical protein